MLVLVDVLAVLDLIEPALFEARRSAFTRSFSRFASSFALTLASFSLFFAASLSACLFSSSCRALAARSFCDRARSALAFSFASFSAALASLASCFELFLLVGSAAGMDTAGATAGTDVVGVCAGVESAFVGVGISLGTLP